MECLDVFKLVLMCRFDLKLTSNERFWQNGERMICKIYQSSVTTNINTTLCCLLASRHKSWRTSTGLQYDGGLALFRPPVSSIIQDCKTEVTVKTQCRCWWSTSFNVGYFHPRLTRQRYRATKVHSSIQACHCSLLLYNFLSQLLH